MTERRSIVSFDLDMTLLDHSDYKIPASALQALERLRTDHRIVLASGRDMDNSVNVHALLIYMDFFCFILPDMPKRHALLASFLPFRHKQYMNPASLQFRLSHSRAYTIHEDISTLQSTAW